QRPQHLVVTTFPVEGLDGRKMSSSWGNTINFNDEPDEMYGKVMSVRDELIEKYLTVLTRVPLSEIPGIIAQHPKDAKMRLAREIVTIYHGADAAAQAEENWTTTFSEGGVPEDMPEIPVSGSEKISDKLVETGIVPSKSELRRLQDASAISEVGGETIANVDAIEKRPVVLRIGKHRFVRIV
ncbi:MAG TPA: tyrosine--tRNA ligase, partial [Candidatus Kapabacteria bacterium]|nr:tyrosine--tRNA ligase [Candidatus Kapabacteria bacterium]